MIRTFTTREILDETNVPFWKLEHLVRARKVKPLSRGRGRERRFTREEYEKARQLLTEAEVDKATYEST